MQMRCHRIAFDRSHRQATLALRPPLLRTALLLLLIFVHRHAGCAVDTVAEAQADAESAKQRMETSEGQKSELSNEIATQQTKLNEMKAQGPPCRDSDNEISKADEELSILRYQEATTLADFRQGFFCSKCNRSKTEIEATGEDFYEHIRRVEGQIIPASPEKIAEKQREFDDRIQTVSQRLDALEGEKNACINQYKEGIADILAQIQELQARWWDLQRDIYAANHDFITAKNRIWLLERQEQEQALLDRQRQLEEARREAEEEERRKKAQLFEEERRARERLENEKLAEKQKAAAEQAEKRNQANEEERKKRQEEVDRIAGWSAFGHSAQREPLEGDVTTSEGRTPGKEPDQQPPSTNDAPIGGTSPEISSEDPPADERSPQSFAPAVSPALEELTRSSARGSSDSENDAIARALSKVEAFVKENVIGAGEGGAATLEQKLSEFADKALEHGPLTPTDAVHEGISAALTDLAREPSEAAGSILLGAVKEHLIDSITDKVAEGVQREIVSAAVRLLQKDPLPEPIDSLSSAQREFEIAVSAPSLLYQTAPFSGPRALRGLHHYLTDAQEKFFRFFGLATDTIIDNENGE